MTADGPGPAGDPEDELAGLRDQLADAQQSARRLARDAAEAALRGRRPPAGGYATPPREGGELGQRSEIEELIALAAAIRDAIPPEIWERLVAVLRELLLALRALADHLVARIEAPKAQPTEVEDIPIL